MEELDPTGCSRVRPEKPKTRGTRPGVRSHTARSSGQVLCQLRFCRQPGHPQPVAEGSDFTTCWPECLILLQISEYTFEGRVPKSPGHISTSTHWLLTVNPAGTRAWGDREGHPQSPFCLQCRLCDGDDTQNSQIPLLNMNPEWRPACPPGFQLKRKGSTMGRSGSSDS